MLELFFYKFEDKGMETTIKNAFYDTDYRYMIAYNSFLFEDFSELAKEYHMSDEDFLEKLQEYYSEGDFDTIYPLITVHMDTIRNTPAVPNGESRDEFDIISELYNIKDENWFTVDFEVDFRKLAALALA